MKYEDQRRRMVERQIMARGITDPALINAFMKVPRHIFVPEDLRRFSYQDSPLRIGCDQTVSQPYIVALMLDCLKITPRDNVLEIGTGSGYQTAIIAELCNKVYTIERIPELLTQAKSSLAGIGYENIYYHLGDGTKGWEKAIPVKKSFTRIIVSAAAPSIPQSLINQLADNGKLIIPTGSERFQELLLISKKGDAFETKKCGGCTFVPLIGDEGWSNE